MRKYFPSVSSSRPNPMPPSEDSIEPNLPTLPLEQNNAREVVQVRSKRTRVDFNFEDLPADPGLRPPISNYHPNDQDPVRRFYLQKGPCQPRFHDFPKTATENRHFNAVWFDEFPSWLEYSVTKDAAFCLYCYLFRTGNGMNDTFAHKGFVNWKRKDKLGIHVGGPTSEHNRALLKAQSLLNQNTSIQACYEKQFDQARKDYRIRLKASVDCVLFLLRQGLSFRGHDESDESINRGNFLELLSFLADRVETIRNVVLKNAPENHQLTSSGIQKEIVNAAATEVTNVILKELEGELFSVLIDESRDLSIKEQMAVVLRYVDKRGCVIERFLGIVHVNETTALSLKTALDSLFAKHSLSISSLRGQGYDGASNMKGEYNGLKTLILRENPSAFFVHCFAHQLQLALVAVAKKEDKIDLLFSIMTSVVNTVGGSCKRRDILREKQFAKIVQSLGDGEIQSGQGLNQETNLKRPGDTRWGSHYSTIINLILMFSSVIGVLEIVWKDKKSPQRGEIGAYLEVMESFEFVFNLHLMKTLLGITNSLSKALQRKDQDIVNAMNLVKVSKASLQKLRDDGWDSLLEEVSLFCVKHDIDIPNMEDRFVARGRSRRNAETYSNLCHYRGGLFCAVIDLQIAELDNRFTEVGSELLICLSCLNPRDSFSSFNKEKLIRFAKFYPIDFSDHDLTVLNGEMEIYFNDVSSNGKFSSITGISDLAKMMVETKKDIVYPLVYLLIKLALILPVATATVERAFSAMHIIKNRLRNRMGDQWLNDCLVTYIEKDIFVNIDTEAIMQRFHNMGPRRVQL